jgi:hypothetical protein
MKHFRFDPPALELTSELRWMLLRGFGPSDREAPRRVDTAEVLRLANRFDLSARIGARCGRELLGRELGQAVAAEFLSVSRRAAAGALAIEATAKEIASVAAGMRLPVVFLKFAGLHLAGITKLGSRRACDLDVLTRGERAEELAAALTARGWHTMDVPECEHQLKPLVHSKSSMVEVHRLVLGVRPSGKGSATAQGLIAAGRTVRLPALPGEASVPDREILCAHALVHGIAQHGLAPVSYPMMRLVADLQDLGGGDPADLIGRARTLVARDVTPVEAGAAQRLCARLSCGDLPADLSGGAPDILLLRHILAGMVEPAYEDSLKVVSLGSVPTDRGKISAAIHVAAGALWMTRGQVDTVYGRPASPSGYLWRRVARPFDLVRRAVRYGISARKVRKVRSKNAKLGTRIAEPGVRSKE